MSKKGIGGESHGKGPISPNRTAGKTAGNKNGGGRPGGGKTALPASPGRKNLTGG